MRIPIPADPGDAIGCNMFAYCGNNPVMRNDYSGDAWWHWVVARWPLLAWRLPLSLPVAVLQLLQ